MAKFILEVQSNTRDSDDAAVDTRKRDFAIGVSNYFKKLASGTHPYDTAVVARSAGVCAIGKVTFATSSGTVGVVINGVTITVTWGTDDTVSAALLAAAINASTNALIQNVVTATSALGVTTVTASAPGISGNWITFVASGTNVSVTGARLGTGAGSTAGSETRVAHAF